MGLSNEVIARFVKAANSKETAKPDSSIYGTVVEYNGRKFVRLDGSDRLTPVVSTVAANADERVSVTIKDHSAVITGNVSSPAARNEDVEDIGNQIAEFDIVIADKVNTQEFLAQIARITQLETYDLTVKNELIAANAEIENLRTKNVEIDGLLTASKAEIDELSTKKIDAEIVEATYAEIKDLEATNAQVHNLNATYASFYDATVNNLKVINGTIDNLSAEYANIDFANIGEAAIKKLFSDTGLIKDLVVGDTTITGELVGVTLKGDLIEAGTLKADRLVVKGTDGNYYKLNLDGMGTSIEVVEEDQIHGKTIVAKSITAEKVSVKDLIAFGATIAKFVIDDSAIRSVVKDGPTNTTRGLYLGNDGQFALGDDINFLRFFEFEEGLYRLEISSDVIKMGGREKTLNDELDEISETTNTLNTKVVEAESSVNSLIGQIANLVTDANGQSLMTQTSQGWTFRTTEIQGTLDDAVGKLGELNEKLGGTDATVNVLQKAVSDLQGTSDYIRIRSYQNEPCIELGETESNLKIMITNTRIMFLDSIGAIPTYIDRSGLITENIKINSTISQGQFSWVLRPNGHLSLMWGENPPTVYNVLNYFNNVVGSNENNITEHGNTYTTVLTPSSGYSITAITVTMNDADITGAAYDTTTNTVLVDYVTGKIVVTATATINIYSITKNFTDVASSTAISEVQHGSSYSDTLIIDDEYVLSSIKVTMGGEDITSTVFSDNEIHIEEAIGDIVITASAIAHTSICSVTNVLDGVTNTNSINTVTVGDSYSTTLNVNNDDYTIGNLVVTMGGTDVTNSVYNPNTGSINISSVTGDIVITATATKIKYDIIFDLIDTISSNTATTIEHGSAYSTVFSPEYDTHKINISGITMGGASLPHEMTVFDGTNLLLNIPESSGGVTGDLYLYVKSTLRRYMVTNNLTDVSTSNSVRVISHGDSYVTTLTTDSDYMVGNVHVYMGDEEITNDVYDPTTNVIDISSVTDAVTISAEKVDACNVIYNLTSATLTNMPDKVAHGSAYETTFVPDTYPFSIIVTMGGVNLTNDSRLTIDYANKIVRIDPVTDDLDITIRAGS